MKIENCMAVFLTGKRLYAYVSDGEFGLCGDEVTYGSDGSLDGPGDHWQDEDRRMNHAECIELAEYMIARWVAFRDKHAAIDKT